MRTLLATGIAAAMTTAAIAADNPDYSLTIYSSAQPGQVSTENIADYGAGLPGYALVRDGRKMTLQSGNGVLKFTDVAKRIDATTVAFESLTDPAGTRVVEQNYQFDLVNRDKLLERYVGEHVTVEQQRGDTLERLSGVLLSSADGTLILQRDSGEVVSIGSYSNVLFPSLPGGLITRPTLVWLVNAKQAGAHDTRVSYQTRGMTWWSDYNITLRENGSNCDMDLSAAMAGAAMVFIRTIGAGAGAGAGSGAGVPVAGGVGEGLVGTASLLQAINPSQPAQTSTQAQPRREVSRIVCQPRSIGRWGIVVRYVVRGARLSGSDRARRTRRRPAGRHPSRR